MSKDFLTTCGLFISILVGTLGLVHLIKASLSKLHGS